jgi:hypothetical protein
MDIFQIAQAMTTLTIVPEYLPEGWPELWNIWFDLGTVTSHLIHSSSTSPQRTHFYQREIIQPLLPLLLFSPKPERFDSLSHSKWVGVFKRFLDYYADWWKFERKR